MTNIDLDAIEARAAAATEGPWMHKHFDFDSGVYEATFDGDLYPKRAHVMRSADAEFIAHARADVPALIAAVRERDAAIAQCKSEIHDFLIGDDRGITSLGRRFLPALDRQERK